MISHHVPASLFAVGYALIGYQFFSAEPRSPFFIDSAPRKLLLGASLVFAATSLFLSETFRLLNLSSPLELLRHGAFNFFFAVIITEYFRAGVAKTIWPTRKLISRISLVWATFMFVQSLALSFLHNKEVIE